MTYAIDRDSLLQHVDGVRRLARCLVGNATDADDIVQETMLAALESQSPRTAGPRAWLAGVTRNKVRRLVRSSTRRREREQSASAAEALPPTSELVIRAAEQSRLLDEIVALQDPYRTAILLRFMENKPPRVIAAQLGLPVETVRTHVKRGLEKLRRRLDEVHGGNRSRWHEAVLPLVGAPIVQAAAPGVSWLAVKAALLLVGVGGGLWLIFAAFGSTPRSLDEKKTELSVGTVGDPERDTPRGETATAEVSPPKKEATGQEEPAAVSAARDELEERAARDGGRAEFDPAVIPVRPSDARAPDHPRPAGGLLQYADNGYANLDPAHASLSRVNNERLILALYEGLTALDPETGEARPAAADSWYASADGKSWTFQLRRGAQWSDGVPVKASDFVAAWSRIMDPYTESNWSWLFRSIKGCGAITDNAARIDAYNMLRKGLKELRSSNPNGIPAADLISLLEDTGVRPFLVGVKSRSVKKMLNWTEDGGHFPPEMVKRGIDALRKEKKDLKTAWKRDFEAFGKAGSGVYAPDDDTLIVTTEGDVPFLPELLARSAFVPIHSSVESLRDKAFEAGSLVGNGPFVLSGRGAKSARRQIQIQVLSVVDLRRSQTYNGPNKAQVDQIKCITDQGAKEDVIAYEQGTLQWVNVTWSEFPNKKRMRPKIEALKGYGVRDTPVVLYLRFRCDREPFNSKEARRAFALSVDRAAIAKRFWPHATPAFRLVPPGVKGRTEGISCPRPDLIAARAAGKAAGFDGETWMELSFGEMPGQDDAALLLIRGWRKTLGVEPGNRIECDSDMRNILRSGKYYAMLSGYRGYVDDPYGYLSPLHSGDADCGLGWRDAAYDALVDAARDATTALADPEKFLATTGMSKLRGALEGAKGGREGRLRLRREALAAAERRILEEYVVVPLLFLKEATLIGAVKGMGSDKAWRNPGYVGALWNVRR